MIINPGVPEGIIHPPTSKSMMQRACAGALLHRGTTTVINPAGSKDDLAALDIIQQLGAHVSVVNQNEIKIVSNGSPQATPVINCGESGLCARMFTPIVSLLQAQVVVSGHGSLLHRPMNEVNDILSQLGVTLPHFNGYLPITIQGPLQPRSLHVDGTSSSQYLTGLLIALTATAQTVVTIDVTNLQSRPYIDLTLDVLSQFGKPVAHTDYRLFTIDPSSFFRKENISIVIDADWSSAAYWLVAAAIGGSLRVNNLSAKSFQADKAIIDVLLSTGANVVVDQGSISVTHGHQLSSFVYDATHSPDLFPILAILAVACSGTSHIKGLSRLIHKESNRTASISHMLTAFGVSFEVDGDTLRVAGQCKLHATTVDSHGDHRIAMAAAIGALNAAGPVIIHNAQAVSKSYPQFFSHLASLGINLESKH